MEAKFRAECQMLFLQPPLSVGPELHNSPAAASPSSGFEEALPVSAALIQCAAEAQNPAAQQQRQKSSSAKESLLPAAFFMNTFTRAVAARR